MALPNIFGANIAQLINNALGNAVFDQTLIKRSSTQSTVNRTKQEIVTSPYPCKGFIDEFTDDYINLTNIKKSDRKIVILGASLAAGIIPEPGDGIIAEGITFTIVPDGIVRDPAGATFTCQAR